MNPLQELEREWKKDRNKGVTTVLTDYFIDRGIDPEPEFERLKHEVELDVEREQLEELSSEHGNFEREPWTVQALTEDEPREYMRGQVLVGREPDYTFGALNLWVDRKATLHFVLDFAPEHLQDQLEREHEGASFCTIYGGFSREYFADGKGQVWHRVAESGLGECRCPYADWDPEEHGEARKNVVRITDTYYGAYPNEWCRLCEAEIGEEHGYLYMGEELNEAVYVRLDQPEQNRATINTPEVEAEVEAEFRAAFDITTEPVETFFEHGQWWVRLNRERSDEEFATYSVVDTDTGFDFEEL